MTFKLRFTCPRCSGAGVITADQLSVLQRRVFAAVRSGGPNGIKAKDLVEKAYADDASGGPDYPLLSIQAAIRELNNRLQGHQIVPTSKIVHQRCRYRIIATEGGHDADGTDHRRAGRDVHRRNSRQRHSGSAAARQER